MSEISMAFHSLLLVQNANSIHLRGAPKKRGNDSDWLKLQLWATLPVATRFGRQQKSSPAETKRRSTEVSTTWPSRKQMIFARTIFKLLKKLKS
jgi:hypothetical protein